VNASGAPSNANIGPVFVWGNTNAKELFGLNWNHTNATFRQAWFHHLNSGYAAAKYTSSLSGSTWYFLVGTWDGGSLRCYLNGNNEATSTAATSFGAPLGGLGIATEASVGFYSGSLDEIRVYTRALDPWEITQLYQDGLSGRRDSGDF